MIKKNESLIDVASVAPSYRTKYGTMYQGCVESFTMSKYSKRYFGKVDLIFTSPPFPLNRKKKYGNLVGTEYKEWFEAMAVSLKKYLSPTGSIVIEMGNSWEPGSPTMSTLALESLLAFKTAGNYNLCQQFICNNPARLPSPAQWVNIERIRVKDSFTNLWWMSLTERPKASNRNVLTAYSKAMKKLLNTGKYNHGARDSEHVIGEVSFLKDNGGAIPGSVLSFGNTASGDQYRKYCREMQIKAHPAPMQSKLVEWFIQFLTDEDDLVMDPFGGSNMTGSIAEKMNRKWVAIEPREDYIIGSVGRFSGKVKVT
jgi:site-specific DNA-methyltransferase (cytosine-N4-specific)